jgi:hypothetical protein
MGIFGKFYLQLNEQFILIERTCLKLIQELDLLISLIGG